jgi:hypothetical protein
VCFFTHGCDPNPTRTFSGSGPGFSLHPRVTHGYPRLLNSHANPMSPSPAIVILAQTQVSSSRTPARPRLPAQVPSSRTSQAVRLNLICKRPAPPAAPPASALRPAPAAALCEQRRRQGPTPSRRPQAPSHALVSQGPSCDSTSASADAKGQG